ncbi:MAG: hypothetical protein BV458_05335 [Thermoplasmata archaeon M9B2D]|nr:MAG: hypothetical protein BV458_05335 [Thermoplasmata archaeon M9B2D]
MKKEDVLMNFLRYKKFFHIILTMTVLFFLVLHVPYRASMPSPDVKTLASYDGPYECQNSTATIKAWTNESETDVTLYYRYSKDNISSWDPGADYVDLTLADAVLKTQDIDMYYPQRLWFDEENQLMYIACRLSHTLQIYDVSTHWNLTKITQLKDRTNLAYIHGIKVINNWSYNGINYGNILLATAGSKKTMFLTLSVNLSTTPTILDSEAINVRFTTLGYLNYFINETGNLIVVVTEQAPIARFTIFDASNPTDIVNLSETIIGTFQEWMLNPTFDPTHRYLYTSKWGDNTTVTIHDISNLHAPVYVGYQLPERPMNQTKQMSMRYPYSGKETYIITMNRTTIDNNCQLTVLDISDPLAWTIVSDVNAYGTGEFQPDYYGEWAAVRYYNGKTNNSGLTVFNIADPYKMFQAGYYVHPSITVNSHMQWVDTNRSRIFALSYTSNAFYAINMSRNLSQAESWHEYEVDTDKPFEWEFDFPNGIGYYEFSTRGSDEDYHITADCRIFSTAEPLAPPTIPLISGPTIGNQDTTYSYSLVSTSVNDDMLQFTVDWGDTSTDTSDLLPNGMTCIMNHSWMDAGVYTISCKAYDTYGQSESANLIVLIDVQYCEEIGYLIDDTNDGVYDLFYSNDTGNETIVGQYDETYLLDIDEDGTWEYTYNSTEGLIEIQNSEEKETPGYELILILYAISIVVIYRWKRKN